MNLTDTHTHIYLPAFENDLYEILTRARDVGVRKFYLPGIDSSVISNMLDLEQRYPFEIFPMMGLHPCSVKTNYKAELEIVEQWLNNRKFVAIGEIGLDFYWDTTFSNEQSEAFNLQMDWALRYNLPVVIHTRNAMKETLAAVEPYAQRGLTGIFHCFGDNNSIARQIIGMGFFLGIGGVVTYKNAKMEEVLSDIPLEKMVLETDAPYLSPVPMRGKRNEPANIIHIAQRLAEIKNVTVEEIARVTSLNAEKIFGR